MSDAMPPSSDPVDTDADNGSLVYMTPADDVLTSPQSLISVYDYLKVLALLLMFVDHIGAFLFPDLEFLRVIGRASAPIWLFLIGYARSRTINDALILSAILVSTIMWWGYEIIQPLNILWVIIFIRLVLDKLMAWIGNDWSQLMFMTAVFVGMAPLTRILGDYGTMAFVFAMWGYIARHGFAIYARRWSGQAYGLIVMASYLVIEQMHFDFSPMLLPLLIGCGAAVYCLLALYFPKQRVGCVPFSRVTQKALFWLGHHTLWLYVGHLAVLAFVARHAYPCSTGLCVPELMERGIDLLVSLR